MTSKTQFSILTLFFNVNFFPSISYLLRSVHYLNINDEAFRNDLIDVYEIIEDILCSVAHLQSKHYFLLKSLANDSG